MKKVALIYDRVNKWGGAERVLLTLHEMFPKAPLYTSVYDKKNASWAKVFPKVHTSFLQNIPFAKGNHEFLAPLMPWAFESFNLDNYDLVISVTSEAAKGIKTGPKTLHLCYCLTPTRYLWSGANFYFNNPPSKFKMLPFFKFISLPFVWYLKWWDKLASQRPDMMIAISTEVQKRIKKYYNRDSEIVFPPVETGAKKQKEIGEKKYFLIVNRLIPYKRVDIAIKVFNKLGYSLYIVGDGTEMSRLKALTKDNIKFLGEISDKELYKIYLGAKALIMPQEEDFGIVSLEAQSFGVPVIAFKKGGAIDTVISGKTGIFFEKQTSNSLSQAIGKFGKMKFNKNEIIQNSQKFSKKRFKKELFDLVKKMLE